MGEWSLCLFLTYGVIVLFTIISAIIFALDPIISFTNTFKSKEKNDFIDNDKIIEEKNEFYLKYYNIIYIMVMN